MMDFLSSFDVGKTVSAHGEQWTIVESVGGGMVLAVKQTDMLPCPVYLIRVDCEKRSSL